MQGFCKIRKVNAVPMVKAIESERERLRLPKTFAVRVGL